MESAAEMNRAALVGRAPVLCCVTEVMVLINMFYIKRHYI